MTLLSIGKLPAFTLSQGRISWDAAAALKIATVAALASASGAALADSATPEGAKALIAGYASLLTQEAIDKGLVTVTPQGDSYLVKWDVQPLIDAAKATDQTAETDVTIEPFSYVLTIKNDHAWSTHADALPNITVVDRKGEQPGTLKVAFDKAQMDSRFDSGAPEPLTWSLTVDPVKIDFSLVKDGATSTFHIANNEVRLDLSAKAGAMPDVYDVTLTQTTASTAQTFSVPMSEGGGQVDIDMKSAPAKGAISIAGLRVGAMRDFFKIASQNKDKGPDDAATKAALKAAFPFFDEFKATGSQSMTELTSAMGTASLEAIGQAIELTGVTADNHARFAMNFDKFSLASPLLPAWVAEAFPLSVALDASADFHDLDKAMALGVDLDGGSEAGDAVAAAIAAKPIKVTLGPTSVRTPIINFEASGSAVVNPKPVGQFHLAVDDLDKLVATARKLGLPESDASNFEAVVALAKGYSKPGANGGLAWDIDIDGDKVLVNGKELPTQ